MLRALSPPHSLPALLALCALGSAVLARTGLQRHGDGHLCEIHFCECLSGHHPNWTTVNCTIPKNEKLDIFDKDLPNMTSELYINGGEAIMFGANSLTRMQDARQIMISGTKVVLFRKNAAINVNIVTLLIEIEKCDTMHVEGRSFVSIKGPLSVMVSNCDVVSMDGQAFSWLLRVNVSHVGRLELGPGTFKLESTAGNVGEHGPGMAIQLKNTTIPEITAQTFGSSAAAITMESVDVYAIRTGAFCANTYNIVMAINCTFHTIEEEAFAHTSLINYLHFFGCTIHKFASRALQSAVGSINISHTRFVNIESGSVNTTVASVIITDSEFNNFEERGFQLSSWNKLHMKRNIFDELAPNAIIAPGASIHELQFIENEIETLHPHSLAFIGEARKTSNNVIYKNNYYGHVCHCNVSDWLALGLGADSGKPYESESYCTVDEFFARCFNVPDQNMLIKKFISGVCTKKPAIKCETFNIKTKDGAVTEIKNPRFPHKTKYEKVLSERNKKVIGIVIISCLVCILIVMLVSCIRWLRRRDYFSNLKNALDNSFASCSAVCKRLFICGGSGDVENAQSISQLSITEYSERHRLNEIHIQDETQETIICEPNTETHDKVTQTLPEELSKELLENLKYNLDNPENFNETKELIEHLYILTKIEDKNERPRLSTENIYELPFQNESLTIIGKNNKLMKSVGTRAPSLERLIPLSPYNRQTALIHEYFEPKDLAAANHLYAEIASQDKEKRTLLGAIPDVVAEQAVPRGPYLSAVRDKMNSGVAVATTSKAFVTSPPPIVKTDTPNKIQNRPLPKKPTKFAGEGSDGVDI